MPPFRLEPPPSSTSWPVTSGRSPSLSAFLQVQDKVYASQGSPDPHSPSRGQRPELLVCRQLLYLHPVFTGALFSVAKAGNRPRGLLRGDG